MKATAPITVREITIGKPTARPVDPKLEEHSPLGPSASERWLQCPGSVLRTKDMPETTSEFAAEGTAAHTLSEWVRAQGQPAKKFIGMSIVGKNMTFVVDKEMADAVQRFADHCDALPGTGHYEERVNYTAWVDGGFGTADDIRLDEPVCYITDLKYGKGVQVYAKDNTQLQLYALGVFQEFGHLYDFERFVLTIHQPRLDHVDTFEISTIDLLKWAKYVVRPAAASALQPGALFSAGEWCRFCPAKNTCEDRAQQMQHLYLRDLEEAASPEGLSGDKLAEILGQVAAIKAWCNDMEAHALSEIQKGRKVGDYKLVAGRSARSWRDEAEAEKALRSVKGLKVRDLFVKKLVSPPQAEKILGKKHPVLEEQVVKSQGKPALVPGSDPRPSLQIDAAGEFEVLGEDE